MTKIEMPKPTSGGLLITYWCNAKCQHCYLQCSKNKGGRMDIEDAYSHIKEFYDVGIPKEDIHLTGGEPFGDFKYLLEILKKANSTNYKGLGFVETNAFWAMNEEICKERLRKIKDLGVQKICISSDIFHQEYIPLKRIKLLIEMGHKILGENSITLRWNNGLKEKKHVGQMKKEEVQNYMVNPLRDFNVRVVGRATHSSLRDYVPKKEVSKFDLSPCFDRMVGKGHYHFDIYNNLIPGIGCLAIGNSSKGNLQKLLNNVDSKDNPFFNWLSFEGPSGKFLEYARERGYKEIEEGYGDKCHLCFDIRRWLVNNKLYSPELGAKEVYNE